MIAQKNVTHMFIAADAALATTNVPTTARYIGIKKVGETLCDAGALTAAHEFQVVYLDISGKVQVSPAFKYANIISKYKIAPISAASQITSIGYNGTTGALVATNSGKYIMTIGYKDGLKQIGNKRLFKYAEYVADATATQPEIALGLAKSLQMNLEKDAFQRITVKALCSYAVTAGDLFDANTAVVKGSKYISHAANHNYSAGESLAVGDYVRLGAVGLGTALTSNVYKVIALTSATVIELDRPVVEPTGTYAFGTVDAEVIRAANANGADWGIRLTAADSSKPFELGKFAWDAIRFDVGLSTDFGTTPNLLTTKPTKGMGTYKEIAQMEWELQNNRREPYRIAEYPVTFTSNAVSTDVYDYIFDIRFRENSTETIGTEAESFVQLVIACVTGGTTSTALGTVFTL